MIKTFLVQRSPAALWLMKTLTFSLEIPKERAQSLSDKNAKSGAVFVIYLAARLPNQRQNWKD